LNEICFEQILSSCPFFRLIAHAYPNTVVRERQRGTATTTQRI
jgi:hypothetical protein